MGIQTKNKEEKNISASLDYCIMDTSTVEKSLESKTEQSGCSVLMMILLSGPRMAASMSWAAQYALMGPFLEFMLPSYAVQLTQFMGPALGLVVSPLVGAMSDSCSSQYGRRRPFLVFGALLSSISWTLFGYTREMGKLLGDTDEKNRPAAAALSIFFYMCSGFAVNAFSTPAQLILADFAGNRQTTAAAVGQAAFTLGTLIVAIYVFTFGFPPATESLHEFFGVLTVVMISTVALVCIYAKEETIMVVQTPSACRQLSGYVSTIWKGITSMPVQLMLLGTIFFCRCYGSTSYHGAKGQFFGLVIYQGNSEGADVCSPTCTDEQLLYVDGVEMAGGRTDIWFSLVGYVFSFFVPPLVRVFGAKNVVVFGMFPQVMYVVMAMWHDESIDVAIIILSAITQAFVDATLVPIIIHVMGEETDIGIYVGVFNSFDCLGQLMNFGLGAALVTSSMGYALPILVGGVVSFIGFLVAALFLTVKLHSI